jgi:hypothetical protein
MTLNTQNVFTTRTGTGWTVDTTILNMDPDITIKDFLVIFTIGGTPVVQNNADFDKLTQTSIQYNGSPIGTDTPVEVRRRTPLDPRRVATYFSRFSSEDYNKELERISRRAYEYETSGVGSVGGLDGTLLDAAFGGSWSGDILNGATRNTLYNKFVSETAAWQAADTGLQGQITTNTGNIAANTTSISSHNTRLNNEEAYTNLRRRIISGRWSGMTSAVGGTNALITGSGGAADPTFTYVGASFGSVSANTIINVNAPSSGSHLIRIYYKAQFNYTLGTTRPGRLDIVLMRNLNGGGFTAHDAALRFHTNADLVAETISGFRDDVLVAGNTYSFRIAQTNNGSGGTLDVGSIMLSIETLGTV